jgi:hypothetical protein
VQAINLEIELEAEVMVDAEVKVDSAEGEIFAWQVPGLIHDWEHPGYNSEQVSLNHVRNRQDVKSRGPEMKQFKETGNNDSIAYTKLLRQKTY